MARAEIMKITTGTRTDLTVTAIILLAAMLLVSACTQTTPSMMNTSKIELAENTVVRQIPVKAVGASVISEIAKDYHRYGNSPLEISIIRDPDSKSFNTSDASAFLGLVKSRLHAKGIRNIKTEVIAARETSPMLVISYDSVTAHKASDCGDMPGLYDNNTGRFIGDYKFGCAIDDMLAKQIYRPADLKGTTADANEPGDGRRAANVAEYYGRVDEKKITGELKDLGRKDLSGD